MKNLLIGILMVLVLAACGGSQPAIRSRLTPAMVIQGLDSMNPNTLTVDECLMRTARSRVKVVAYTGAVHLWPNRAVARCGLPEGWDVWGNNVESIYGGPPIAHVLYGALWASPSHRAHMAGVGGFAGSTRIGVANLGVWWVIHTAPIVGGGVSG